MSQLKEMVNDKKFYFLLLISITFFGMLVKTQYALDLYSILMGNAEVEIAHFCGGGRFLTAFFLFFFSKLPFPIEVVYRISFVVAILCITIAMYKLNRIIEKDVTNKNLAMIIAIAIIINAFSIELFLFIEKGIMLFSVLLNVLAVEALIEYFEGKKRSLLFVFFYMFLASISYQGTVALFVCLALVYILKYSQNIQSFIKNMGITALAYGIPAFIDYVIARVFFVEERLSGGIRLGESLKKIVTGSLEMIGTTYTILPKFFWLAFIGIELILLLKYILEQKEQGKQKLITIAGIGVLLLGSMVTTVFPQFLQSTDEIWFVPRSTYAIASLVGILMLYLVMNFKTSKKMQVFFLSLFVLLLAMEYKSFQDIERDQYIVNRLDQEIATNIIQRIEEYELQNKQEITKIIYYQDEQINNNYVGIKSFKDTNLSALSQEWSSKPLIEWKLNRKLQQGEYSKEIYETYFKGKDWKRFDLQQLVLQGDTLHICMF